MKVDVFGVDTQTWQSVERSRIFYEKALSTVFDLRLASRLRMRGPEMPDVALNFSGKTGWSFNEHPPYPLVYALHGGPILSHDFLATQINRLKVSDAFIVNCRSDLEIFKAMANGESCPATYLVPLPVNLLTFKPGNAIAARSQLDLESAAYVIGFVGRLLPQKNLHHFLDLLASLKKILQPARVMGLVVGTFWLDYPILNFDDLHYPDYVSSKIKDLDVAEDIVYLKGSLCETDLATCYHAMDVLFHPTHSIDENFGYVPVEAMACGIPVIGYAYGGLKDTVVPQVGGLLRSTWTTRNGIRANSVGIAAECANLLVDKNRLTNLKRTAFQHAVHNFSFQRCANALIDCINEVKSRFITSDGGPACAAQPLPICNIETDLPTNEWKDYRSAVDYYVSGRCPIPSLGSTISLAAPLQQHAFGEFRSLDATWPLSFCPTQVQKEIIKYCHEGIDVRSLLINCTCTLSDVADLLERGVLISDAPNDRQSKPIR